ncbi:MAG: hypothetical protein HOV83_21980 [Catenulispora sp.]|nr:hypothetical protein [Catenulispora sp.]
MIAVVAVPRDVIIAVTLLLVVVVALTVALGFTPEDCMPRYGGLRAVLFAGVAGAERRRPVRRRRLRPRVP